MLREPETRTALLSVPSVNRPRPATLKSQNICHVFASTFKDLYSKDVIGKDTLSNFIKTKNGRSSYHNRYVEELQRAHCEYSQSVREADMLENHIIQARARAAETESQAHQRMRETMGEGCDQRGILLVKSAFCWCVDSDLLRMNNLISPQDYLTAHKPQVEAPTTTMKHDLTKPTIAFSMRVSREPQDDGYSLIPGPGKKLPEMNELDLSLTFESGSDISKGKKNLKEPTQTLSRPKWKDEPSAKDRTEGQEYLQRLKDRTSFLRNPRFLPPNTQHGGTSLIRPRTRVQKMEQRREEQSSTETPAPVFLAKPSIVVFTNYSNGQVYETTLELKNLTSVSRQIRVIPPTTPYFSIGLGRFPGEGGVVAPGMSCKYMVRFAPDSLRDYEDFLVVETQAEELLVVSIVAKQPPPVLTLPGVLDCGYCLVGGIKFVEFLCKNLGLSAGSFCIIPKKQWPASNLRSIVRTPYSEEPPFAVSPSLFVLQPGEAIVVEVVFFPTTAEKSRREFTVVCDNCQVKDVAIEGEGQCIALELLSVSGTMEAPVFGAVRDVMAEHFVRFGPCNPHSVQERKIIIRNNVHLELPFSWGIMKPNLHPLLPRKIPEPSRSQFHLAEDDVFHISPPTGVLAPCQEQEFLFTFFPKELKDYHSVCHLVVRDVPQLPSEPSGNGTLQPVGTGSKLNDVIAMAIEVKGSTEPYQVLLEPYAVVIPGEIYISRLKRSYFKMWNHSKTSISFTWERRNGGGHIIEVVPPTGRIEENECSDFDLIITGTKPGRLITTLDCYIEHHHEPVTLAVEVSFKGPIVTLSVPSVDFGLLKLGERTQTSLLLTNTTQMKASWALQTVDCKDTQILVEPCRGVLLPLASCSVNILFTPHFCQQYETELELTVEDGTGCHLLVQADVQTPQVCLLNCELRLSDLYIGVPAKGTITLFNQTLLPSHFRWMPQLQGRQSELCSAIFDPPCGSLGPNASLEVTVNFTSHTDLELTEVAAVCEVQEMNSPLVLHIIASNAKKLCVSYSLPRDSSSPDNNATSSPLLLDFGDVMLNRAVTNQLLITNQTAIPAAFTVEAEYFTCHASQTNKSSERRSDTGCISNCGFTYVKKPLHSVQAKKVEDKAHEGFVSSLLAHGKGAAFFISPDTGNLGPFETQTLDVTAYNNMWGEYRDHLVCKVGELEATLIPMQMTVKGCPLYFQMTGQNPDKQNQGPIIRFGTHLSGGDTVSRSLRINNPTAFDIRVDWETYNVDPSDRKLVDVVVAYGGAFPLKDADGNEVMSGALRIPDGSIQTGWEGNETPESEGTSSCLQSMTGGEECISEDVCEEEKTCLFPFPPKKKLISVHVRPHMGNLSDYPYCITPQQIVIPGKSSSTIHVSFTPLTLSGSVCESRCVGLAQGFLSLDSEMAVCVPGKVGRTQGLDLEPVRIDLLAVVKPATLFVQMEDGEEVLEFRASAGDLLEGDSERLSVREFKIMQTLQLKNTLEMPLHFRLGTQLPFSVLKPQPRARTSSSSNPPTGEGQSLVLHPQRSIQVTVAFHCSMSLLDHAAEQVPSGVRLIHDAGGRRKMRFQQNLLIHYSNNSLQTVSLQADLYLPTIHLSTDNIHFGFCYVGQTQTREITLCSEGAHTYWKSLIDTTEGDSHAFRVTPDFGLLRSEKRNIASCRQCLQISFTPTGAGEFRATAVIRAPLVKTPLTLQLQGTGSFDEAYMSDVLMTSQ
ncbi:deleted in lung and esophageal cancer protein 1 [Antennarius striatus]|uniref:deleted in lung and esophageal cancer protein 1 n=1 Tax=Antennarius striatus TaxID=241820 RepID=UPI0035B0DDEC